MRRLRLRHPSARSIKALARQQQDEARRARFYAMLQAAGVCVPIAEVKFLEDRKFRFDYAWVHQRVAVEVEGGIWGYGRHNRPAGMLKDMEKYNLAAQEGWILLRYTPQQLCRPETILQIRDTLEGR